MSLMGCSQLHKNSDLQGVCKESPFGSSYHRLRIYFGLQGMIG